MILSLFLVFVTISLVMIIIGLARPSESAQAIVGFFFLFLLATSIIIPGNLEYKTGYYEYYVYGNNFTGYHWDYDTGQPNNPQSEPHVFYINRTDEYRSFKDSPGSSGFGWWLAVASAVGMAGVFYSLKNTKWREE